MEKIAPLKPLTKAEWEEMNHKAKWDTIVALRGPDLAGSGLVKWFTTSVLRAKMRKITETHGSVNDKLPFVVLPKDMWSESIGSKKGEFDLTHFVQHVQEAATWLSIPIAYVPLSSWKLLVSSKTEAYNKLFEDLQEPYRSILKEALSCPE